MWVCKRRCLLIRFATRVCQQQTATCCTCNSTTFMFKIANVHIWSHKCHKLTCSPQTCKHHKCEQASANNNSNKQHKVERSLMCKSNGILVMHANGVHISLHFITNNKNNMLRAKSICFHTFAHTIAQNNTNGDKTHESRTIYTEILSKSQVITPPPTLHTYYLTHCKVVTLLNL